MDKLQWHTEQRKVDDLIPYEQNPRKLTERQLEQLKLSLEKFDLVEIPAIDLDNKIIAGHQRLRVLQLIGRGQGMIDVRVPNRKLTKEEFDEYLLRSNKNTGDWDWDMLANNFNPDFLFEIGFSQEELGMSPNFNPVDEEDQPRLDRVKTKKCPSCGYEYE